MRQIDDERADERARAAAAERERREREATEQRARKEWLEMHRDMAFELLDTLSGEDFERALHRMFLQLGFNVKLTKGSGDQGADLLLERDGTRIAVQAKRYIGIVLLRFRHRFTDQRWRSPFFVWFFLIFAVLWTSITAAATIGGYFSLRRALNSGNAQFVEGFVQHFKPMPYEGHAMESFDLGGQHFEYSDYVVTPGFNKTKSHGGPVSEGKYLRVWYRGGTILRLEICNP